MTDYADDDWVRESVIERVRSGDADISRSGAFLAERREGCDEILVYRIEEAVDG